MSGLKLNGEECDAVERLTRGQGKNVNWQEERKTRITASNFGEVTSLRPDTPIRGPLKRIMYPPILRNKYVTWGIKHEPAARRKYCLRMKPKHPDVKVTEHGLFTVLGDAPYLGASPDGMVSYNTTHGQTETGVLEIKCPASDKWRVMSPEECSKDPDFFCVWCEDAGTCKLKTSHCYYPPPKDFGRGILKWRCPCVRLSVRVSRSEKFPSAAISQ